MDKKIRAVTIRFDSEKLVEAIQLIADQNKRSFNSEVLVLLEKAVLGTAAPPVIDVQNLKRALREIIDEQTSQGGKHRKEAEKKHSHRV